MWWLCLLLVEFGLLCGPMVAQSVRKPAFGFGASYDSYLAMGSSLGAVTLHGFAFDLAHFAPEVSLGVEIGDRGPGTVVVLDLIESYQTPIPLGTLSFQGGVTVRTRQALSELRAGLGVMVPVIGRFGIRADVARRWVLFPLGEPGRFLLGAGDMLSVGIVVLPASGPVP